MIKFNFEFKIIIKNILFGVKNRVCVKIDKIGRYINEGMDE